MEPLAEPERSTAAAAAVPGRCWGNDLGASPIIPLMLAWCSDDSDGSPKQQWINRLSDLTPSRLVGGERVHHRAVRGTRPRILLRTAARVRDAFLRRANAQSR